MLRHVLLRGRPLTGRLTVANRPDLNVWLPSGSNLRTTPPNHQGNGGYLAGQDAAFWTSSYGADGDFRLGWHGYIRIDGTTWQWMGNGFGTLVRAGKNAHQLSAEYTTTRTRFAFDADGVRFNVTFLTPITAKDYARQSLPLSYLHIDLDEKTLKHRKVQLFTDIDERWVTAHDFTFETHPYDAEYVRGTNGTNMYLVHRRHPEVYQEYRQRAEWGSSVYATEDRPGLTSRNNNNVVAHREFLERGKLTYDHGRVSGPDNSFGYAVDLNHPDLTHAQRHGVTFVVGHIRTPYVNYIRRVPGTKDKSYQEDRYGYWQATWPNFYDAISFFVKDFSTMSAASQKLDETVWADSVRVAGGGTTGREYAAITTLSARQALATVELTVSRDRHGEYRTDDTLAFLKEISSNGDMSTVDVTYPLFPILSYLNVDLMMDLLKPIFEYSVSGLYPNKWCVHDLGVYPNAFGHNDGQDEPMQVEESGNMLLMTLHWAQLVAHDPKAPKKDAKRVMAFLEKYYDILAQWTGFLIEDSLVPARQLSTDDFAGPLANQTDLAIKGILGVGAMAEIAAWVDKPHAAKRYRRLAENYVQRWANYSIARDGSHIKLAYQADKSWGTLYNLFADRLLNLQLVPRSIYDVLERWYPTVAQEYGVPLDSRHEWGKSDWMMFAAFTHPPHAGRGKKPPAHGARDLFVHQLYAYVSDGLTDSPFSDLYETTTGDTPKPPHDNLVHFLARPVVGGHFMGLAMDKAYEANGLDSADAYEYAPEFPYAAHIDATTAGESQAHADVAASPRPAWRQPLAQGFFGTGQQLVLGA